MGLLGGRVVGPIGGAINHDSGADFPTSG